jgi:hypothetical protein
MDRGNRRILVASTLLTIPLALLIAAQSGGAPPTTGKLPASKQPGLLSKLGDPTSKPKSSGLLNSLVESLGTDQSTERHSARTTHNQRHSHSTTHNKPRANWEGIPYHKPDNSNHTASGPIRDPGVTASPIVRSKPRTINAIPASARKLHEEPQQHSILIQNEPRVLPIPTPPKLDEPSARRLTTTTNLPLSANSSSRRQNRRQVGPLEADEVMVAQDNPEDNDPGEDAIELAPKKFARRALPEPEATEIKPAPETAEVAQEASPTAAPTPVASPEPTAQAASEPTPASEPTATPEPIEQEAETKAVAEYLDDAPTPKPLTALETIANKPVPSAEIATRPHPELTPIQQPAPAISTLSPPTPTPAPEASTEPSVSEPIPTAGVPTHQFSAIPSEPAAHRAGPPASAFEPRQAVMPQSPTTAPLNMASTPVGSGIAAQSPDRSTAVFRKPDFVPPATPEYPSYMAQQPRYAGPPQSPAPTPAPTHSYPVADPYAAQGIEPPQSFPASGQPISASDAAVPMHPIANHPAPAEALYPGTAAGGAGLRRAAEEANTTLRPGETAVASELPGIRVVTHGPSSIMIRQTHQFEIRVENRGSIDADGVMVRALIPDWAEVRGQTATRGGIEPQNSGSVERLVWTIDHLPAGATERMYVRLKAERSGTHGLDVDWTLVPQKSIAKVHVHEPELQLSIDGPDEVIYGQSQTYKVRVLNPGDGVAPNVIFTLSPNSATPQTQRIGDIPSGKEAQFEVELTAQDLGDLKIHGLASGDLDLRAEATKTIRVAAAKLEAILSGPELKYQDTEAQYHLQLKNAGVAASEQIVATLRLPAGVKYLGGIDDAQQRGSVLTWNLRALTPGAVRDYQFRCQMSSPGDQVLLFDCRGTAAGAADVSIGTRVESISDLVLTINDPVAPAPVGGEVVYEIIIRNRGSKDATDVRAIAQFSHGIEPRRIEGHSGELLTGQVLFDNIPRIGAGDEVKLKVIAEADQAGHHRFRSEIRSGDTVLVAEEATHYMSQRSERVSRHSSQQQQR